jgi:hypothetical protein
LDAATQKWYANADEISAFLSKANPNWKGRWYEEDDSTSTWN